MCLVLLAATVTSDEPTKDSGASNTDSTTGTENAEQIQVESLLEFSSNTPLVFAEVLPGTGHDAELYLHTQVALLRSPMVLRQAVKQPEVAKAVSNREDPVGYLAQNIDVELVPKTALIRVGMAGPADQQGQMVLLVNAVVEAYTDEFINQERRDQFKVRDSLNHSLRNLNEEIRAKWDEYRGISRESGADVDRAPITQQIDLRQFDRLADEILQVEKEIFLLRAEQADRSEDPAERRRAGTRIGALANWKSVLEQRQGKILEGLSSPASSTELAIRRAELEQRQEVANRLAHRIELLDIALQDGPRIRVLQRAMAE